MKRIYQIEGLDCANCAREVETHLNQDPLIKKATIDFVGRKLFLDFGEEPEYSIEDLTAKIAEVEGGVTLAEFKEAKSGQRKKKSFLESPSLTIIRLVIAAVLMALAYFWPMASWLQITIYVLAYMIAGLDVVYQMLRNMWKGHIFTEYTLMTVATIGALAIKEFPEAVLVMVLYQIGELLQDAAVEHSRNTIRATLALRPKTATIIQEGHLFTIEPEQLKAHDLIDIKVGEMIPVDGRVVEGKGTIDVSSLTGESMPVAVNEKETVLSGTTLLSGHLVVEVEKVYQDSTIHKIIELIETNGEKKAKAERFVSKFARIYTPIVFVMALIIAVIPPLFAWTWEESIYRASIFLVVSCPCSIVISVPLTYYVGMGSLAKKGVIVKGAQYLDAIREAKTIVFDKTGTLTKGKFVVTKIESQEVESSVLLEWAAYAESISTHPIAHSIISCYGHEIDASKISQAQEVAAQGVQVTYQKHVIRVGKADFCHAEVPVNTDETIVYVSVDDKYAGYLTLADEIKDEVPETIADLHRYGLRSVMLSGDRLIQASKVANQLHLDEVKAELLPEEKVQELEKIIQNARPGERVIYVGDGVNDAPSIVRADVGIAMGGVGSEATIESADVVLMNDHLDKVVTTIRAARSTKATAIFNIVFSLAVKVTVYVLALFGIASMWLALLADVGVTLLLIFNALYLRRRLDR